MNTLTWFVLVGLALCASPFVSFYVVKFGAYGYFRAKQMAKRKEVSSRENRG